MDPNQERAVQAAFDGYVPAAELQAAHAENERLRVAMRSAWAAKTLDDARTTLRNALRTRPLADT